MKIKEFLQSHELEGSLLEKICYDEKSHELDLEIDYCFWRQDNYSEERETGIVHIVFERVSKLICQDHEINSDEIIYFNQISTDEVEICVENDLTSKYFKYVVRAESIRFEI